MSICEVKAAFRQVASEEFKDIPQENRIEWCLSPRFVKKMVRLIRNEKRFTWKYTNTAKKRLVLVAVIIIALFITACSVKPIRTSVVSFFKEVYERFIHVTFTGDTIDKLEYKYTFSKVPEGFIQVSDYSDNTRYFVEWKNDNNNIIQLSQSITKGTDTYKDNEKLEHQELDVDGIIIDIYTYDDVTIAEWIEYRYYFSVYINGECTIPTLIDMIRSLK